MDIILFDEQLMFWWKHNHANNQNPINFTYGFSKLYFPGNIFNGNRPMSSELLKLYENMEVASMYLDVNPSWKPLTTFRYGISLPRWNFFKDTPNFNGYFDKRISLQIYKLYIFWHHLRKKII